MTRGLLWETIATDAVAVQTVLRVDAWLLFGGTKLSDRLSYRSNVDVGYFYALVVINLERFVNDSRRAFNSNRFVRALTTTQLRLLVLSILNWLFFNLSILVCEGKQVFIITSGLFAVLLVLVKFNRGKQLFLSQKGIYLFHKLQSSVLLVKDQSINWVYSDGDFSAVEEELKLGHL